ncbi:MAG: squalene/phytoene synthase family protein [Cohaesibacter sp.]|jgi:phytoene synthase|nr:squalene/phytoene synthase family protein [Cohaesibacter sp.]
MPDQHTDQQADQLDQAFCQDHLRKLDPLRHFMALTAGETHRDDLIAFYAFLGEIERIPMQVTEPAMGEIRLQWWRDIIAQGADLGPEISGQHDMSANAIGPLAKRLQQLQAKYNLPKGQLDQIVEARTFDLYHDVMPDWEAYETYVGETSALPIMLACQILNNGDHPDLADLCGNTAMALSLTSHLYEWSARANQKQLFLPLAAFKAHGLDQNELWAQEPAEKITQSLSELREKAADYHKLARADYDGLKQSGKGHLATAFLQLSCVPPRLKQLRKSPFSARKVPLWQLYWAIWRLAGR